MKISKTLIAANSSHLSELLHKGLFDVPWHQRYYDWELKDVQEFLLDVQEAVLDGRDCYFLGTVILVQKEDHRWEINDGQQRMITFSLICAALCRKFSSNGLVSHNEAKALCTLFNLHSNETCSLSEAQNYIPRITPQKDDRVTYWSLIRGNSIGTNGIIVRAWNEIERFVSEQTFTQSEKYFNFLIQKLEIAYIQVPQKIDPNAVYETINCRGKELDDLDRIRNHIYSFFNADEYSEKRKTVHDNLERIGTKFALKRKASEYMRCHLQCLFGFLRKDRFYRDVRNEIKNQALQVNKSLPDFVFTIAENVANPKNLGLFSEVITSSSPDPTFVNAFIRDSRTTGAPRNLTNFLWELYSYKVTQPLVFAFLMVYLTESDGSHKKKLAKMIHKEISQLTTFVLRTAFVARKFEPSYFEAKFSNFAKKITLNEENSINQFTDFLKECDQDYLNILNDSKFKERLYEAGMTGNNKIKRFLFGINRTPSKSFQIFNDREFTVEHILPRSSEHWQNWNGFVGKDSSDWVNRIGNLTLLTKADNKPGSKFNGNFEQKKIVFKESSLSITSQLAEYDDWTPENIQERQRHMVDQAAKVWRFDQ